MAGFEALATALRTSILAAGYLITSLLWVNNDHLFSSVYMHSDVNINHFLVMVV